MWFNSFEVSASKSAGPPHPRELLLRKSIAKTNRPIQGDLCQVPRPGQGNSEDKGGRAGVEQKRD